MFKFNRLLLVYACIPSLSYAVLGGNYDSVMADNLALAPRASTVATTSIKNPNYSIATIKANDQTTINEYLTSDGKVFAISWQGKKHPNLKVLLGNYASRLSDVHHGLTSTSLSEDDFNFNMGGLPGHLYGRAYLPLLLPTNVNANTLK